jgi:hypothetical protein
MYNCNFTFVVDTLKLINTEKKIFFYVGAICNLAIEFNGLVSIKGQQKC